MEKGRGGGGLIYTELQEDNEGCGGRRESPGAARTHAKVVFVTGSATAGAQTGQAGQTVGAATQTAGLQRHFAC